MRKNQLENADRMDIVDQNGFGGDKSERSRGEIVKHHLRTNRQVVVYYAILHHVKDFVEVQILILPPDIKKDPLQCGGSIGEPQ